MSSQPSNLPATEVDPVSSMGQVLTTVCGWQVYLQGIREGGNVEIL